MIASLPQRHVVESMAIIKNILLSRESKKTSLLQRTVFRINGLDI